MTADDLHQQLLRLVYRLLFLFTAEERDLLHDPGADSGARNLYAQGYSLARLRDRARLRRSYDRFNDLWSALTVTFRGLAIGAQPLGLPALGGLFESDQCPALDCASLPNSRLLAAIHALAFFTVDGSLQRVNYRDMDTEELGSVYESLLELHPVVQVSLRPWTFGFLGDEGGPGAAGSQRKLSGSYYTPDTLVQELLRSALEPVIVRVIRDNSADPRAAVLRLRVLDPACGSGHFLLGAARRLANAVARLDSEGELPDEALRRRALREVVRRCLFGVDRNPLSVELCKTALWIEAIEPGKPLTFLDAHIKCGDSLIGISDLSALADGIPDEAFKDLTGDDKGYAREMRKRNKLERENPTFSLVPEVESPRDLAAAIAAITDASEDTLEAVHAKRKALAELQNGRRAYDLRTACDLWCAAFFMPKSERPEMRGRELVPTTDTVWRYLRAPSLVYGPMIGAVETLRTELRFFHWPLEFPDAFAAGGFDCVLGNPPWEKINLSDEEFFSTRSATIAKAANKHLRRSLIASLPKDDPKLSSLYEVEKRRHDGMSLFLRSSFFPLTGVSRINFYSVFCERAVQCTRVGGRVGVIVPSGFFSDSNNQQMFSMLLNGHHLDEVNDFENKLGIFDQVHRSYRFSLLSIMRGDLGHKAQFRFYLTEIEQLKTSLPISIGPEEINRLNPIEGVCPSFRSNDDAQLAMRIFSVYPAVGERVEFGKPRTPFNAANDSGLFVPLSNFGEAPVPSNLLSLYEAKMIFQFDHRYSSFGNPLSHEFFGEFRTVENERKTPDMSVVGEYLAPIDVFSKRFSGRWLLVYRDITHAVNERTSIATIIPFNPCVHTLSIVDGLSASNSALICANMNSLVYDYLMRQRIAGTHFSHFIWKQSPFIPEDSYGSLATVVKSHVLELIYTAKDLEPFSVELGHSGPPFIWNEDRRAFLRAELDAAYACLYGLTRDELRYILDPADIHGPEFPSETFRVLRDKEIRQYGEYRTARLVLTAWDRLTEDGTFESWQATHSKP